jgi:hypothetical protein
MEPERNGQQTHPISVSSVVASDGNAGMRIKLFVSLRQEGRVIASMDAWAAGPEEAKALGTAVDNWARQAFGGLIKPVGGIQ